MEINQDITTAIDQWANAPGLTSADRAYRNGVRGMMLADIRLFGLRELMKFEMPDRWSDVANQTLPSVAQSAAEPDLLRPRPLPSATKCRRKQRPDRTKNGE